MAGFYKRSGFLMNSAGSKWLNFQPAPQASESVETAASVGTTPVEREETWADMSEERRALWTFLGWTAERWAEIEPEPETEKKDFVDLDPTQQAVVLKLGYTPESWDAERD